MSRRPAEVPLTVWWQSAVWPRSPSSFWAKLTERKPPERVDPLLELKLAGPRAHDDILPLAVRALRGRAVPPPSGAGS
ncbi:MAG: hypothetical protein EOO73_11375 [Myxococcales bacterium]|nr:MAG: hypothetical protein EOO73_11375 [Myxococcales bacterium]